MELLMPKEKARFSKNTGNTTSMIILRRIISIDRIMEDETLTDTMKTNGNDFLTKQI